MFRCLGFFVRCGVLLFVLAGSTALFAAELMLRDDKPAAAGLSWSDHAGTTRSCKMVAIIQPMC